MTTIHTFDADGNLVGPKSRSKISRTKDVLPSVYVLVFDENKNLVLAEVGQHPNSDRLYAGRLGAPAATFISVDEDHSDAAKRALEGNLGLTNKTCTFLGTYFETFSDGVKRHAAVYYCTHDDDLNFDKANIVSVQALSRKEIEELLEEDSENFAPSFVAIWNRHEDKLPF